MKSETITLRVRLGNIEVFKSDFDNTTENNKRIEKLLTKYRDDFLNARDNVHIFRAKEAKYKRFVKCGWLNESVPFDFSQPLKLSYSITHK